MGSRSVDPVSLPFSLSTVRGTAVSLFSEPASLSLLLFSGGQLEEAAQRLPLPQNPDGTSYRLSLPFLEVIPKAEPLPSYGKPPG